MSVTESPTAVIVYLLAINAVTFCAFAWDKHCAIRQMWRVPERTLLLLAAAGGSPGALTAQQVLRHKTRKQLFGTYLGLILVLQVILLAALGFPEGRAVIRSFLEAALNF